MKLETLGVVLSLFVVTSARPAYAARECANLKNAEAIINASSEKVTFSDDFKMKCRLDSVREGQKTSREMVFYLRGSSGRDFMTLTTNPKTEAGNGYLRIARNLWFYDAKLGRWERRTEREQLGGELVAADFGRENPLEEYDVSYEDEERTPTGSLKRVLLRAKKGVEVTFPIVRYWFDEECLPRKQQVFTAEERLLRTMYVESLARVKSKARNKELLYPSHLRFVDEVQKDRTSEMKVLQFDFAPFPPNIFSKAWLESRSR